MNIHRSSIENFLLIVLLGFAPLALASVHAWAYCTLAALALIIFSSHFLNDIDAFKRVIKRPESIGALAFLAVSLLYVVPLPPDVIKLLSPNTWNLWQNYTIDPPKLMTLSLYVHATMLYILKFVTYFMVFLVVVSKIGGRSSVVSRQSSEDRGQRTEHETKDKGKRIKDKEEADGLHLCNLDGRATSGNLCNLPPNLRNLKHGSHIANLCNQHNAFILLGSLCAVLSILFHSLSDFNLHIPANALYFTVMLAIITGLSGRSTVHGPRSTEGYGAEQSSVVGRQSPDDREQRTETLNAERRTLNADSPHDELTSSRAHEPKQGVLCGSPHASRFTLHASRDTGFLNLLVNSIILIAFVIAVFGIIQKLSYNGNIYWLIVKDGAHFGPYVNYDHYAGYMEMCVFLSLASFLAKISDSSFAYMKKWKDKVVWFSTKEANKTLIYLFFAVIMATALFMTTSRGGIMSFLGALSVLYFTCLISAEAKKRNRILMASALVVLLIVIMFAWVGPEETIGRFQALQVMINTFINEKSILSEIRPFFWQDTMNMIKDFPVTGVGFGAYSYIFPKFRTFAEGWGFLQFAHNDYIQLIAEMGAVGGVFLCGFFVWYIRKFRGCLRGLKENG